MTLAIATICHSIAALSVSGVTIKDYDEIPLSAERLCPVIFPKPDGFISGLTITRQSVGTTVWKRDVTYNLTYTFCYAPIGGGRVNMELYDDMVVKAFAFIDVIMANDAVNGLVDLSLADALDFGPVLDPAGNAYHGCTFVLKVLEFQDE
jgi:hypothetical protein